MEAKSKIEAKFLLENRDRAFKQIHTCMITLSIYSAYNLIYSITLKAWAPSCTNVFLEHRGMNNVLWFFSRGMTDYFWIYPFILIFWPK